MSQLLLRYLSICFVVVICTGSVAQAALIFTNEDPDWQPSTNSAFVLDVVDEFDQVDLKFGAALDARIGYDKINDVVKFNRDVDLEGNELRNFQFENLDTANEPVCNPSFRGKIYFNTDQAKLLICDGTSWEFGDGSLLDEDDFSSNSDTLGATQQSIGVYVDTFLNRALSLQTDGKYVIEKTGSAITFVKIENESPGGASLFAIAPGKITTLDAPEKTFSSVNLVWIAPSNDGAAITDYIVQYRLVGAGSWITFADGVSTDTTTTVTGLTDDTEYEFRVTATNGNVGIPSDVLPVKTFLNDPFFSGDIQMMNVGVATSSVVTALEDNTVVTRNGAALTTLVTRGDTFQFVSAAFDILGADKPVFVAGNASNSNVVWSLPYWAGESFAFNTIRSNPQTVRVYAFEAATVEIKSGATTVAGPVSIAAGGNNTFTFSQYGSFQIESTGLVMAYHYSNNYTDPKPLLPASTDIIGFPSSSMRVTTTTDGTAYTGTHSNSAITLNTLDLVDSLTISPQGTSSLYQSESLRITADQPITGASYADSNGGAAAPFVPVTAMKTRYAINVATDYVAFASVTPGTINLLDASDTIITTLTLTRSGASSVAPYRARYDEGAFGGKITAGTRIIATTPVAAWYQPGTSTGAGNDDETVMYGFD